MNIKITRFTKRESKGNQGMRIIVSHDGSRVLYDKENPRVEIEIKSTEKTGWKKGVGVGSTV